MPKNLLAPPHPPSNFRFEAEQHEYFLGDRQLHSVTHVVEAVLKQQSQWWKPEHAIRGKYVHLITEAIDDNDWDPNDTVIPTGFERDKIINRGVAYERFLSETGFVTIAREVYILSEVFGIAGRVDKLGYYTKGAHAGKFGPLDIKSGPYGASAIMQTALYQLILEGYPQYQSDGTPIQIRTILQLRDDGQPRPEYRTKSDDLADALALLRVFWFMQKTGLLEP